MIRAPRNRKGWSRRAWHATVRTVRGVVLLEDTPYRIAMGSACGIFAAFLPVVGQTLVGMVMSWLARGNLMASMPWSWISNPATTLPIWYGCYVLGVAILPGYDKLGYAALTSQMAGMFEHGVAHFAGEALRLFGSIFIPTLLGSCIVGTVAAIPGFFAVRAGVRWMHARRAQRSAAWRERLLAAAGREGEPIIANLAPPPPLTPPSPGDPR